MFLSLHDTSWFANMAPKDIFTTRSLNSAVFRHWPRLAFLTLENIMVNIVAQLVALHWCTSWKRRSHVCSQVENIVHCLEEVGGQLKGLKIQCNGFDLSDIAVLCPHLRWAAHHRTCKINIHVDKFPLRSLIIQKESPNSVINPLRSSKSRLFGQLEHVEVSCPQVCFSFSK